MSIRKRILLTYLYAETENTNVRVCHVDVDRRKSRVTSLSSINLRYGPHVPCYAAFNIKPAVWDRADTVHFLDLHILPTQTDMDTKVSLSENE